jgi:hypothetical protein
MTTYSENTGTTLISGATDAQGDPITVRRINGSVPGAWPASVALAVGSVRVSQNGAVTFDDGAGSGSNPEQGQSLAAGSFTFTLWDGATESPAYTATVTLTGAAAVVAGATTFGALTSAGQGGIAVTGTGIVSGDASGHWQISGGYLSPSSAGDAADLPAGSYSLVFDDASTLDLAIEANSWTVRGDAELATKMSQSDATLSGNSVALRPGTYAWVQSHWANRYFGNATSSSYTNGNVKFTAKSADPANKAIIACFPLARFDNPTNLVWKDLGFLVTYRPGTDVYTNPGLWVGTGPVRGLEMLGCDFFTNMRQIGMTGAVWGLIKLGNSGPTGVQAGGCTIRNCTFDGAAQAISASIGQNNAEEFLIERTTITGYYLDCMSIGPTTPSQNDTTRFTVRDVLMTDPWGRDADVDFGASATLTRTSLTGAANARKFTFFGLVRANADNASQLVYQQGANLVIKFATVSASTSRITVTAKDTGGNTVVSLTSATAFSVRRGEWIGVLVTLDTDGTHRLHCWSNRYGAVGWALEASQAGGGQTLELTSGTAQIGATNVSFRWLSVWHGVTLDATAATNRDFFIDATDPTYLPVYASADPYAITIPAGLVAALGAAIVQFGRSYAGWQAGANTGTGGNFTKAGIVERSHGDGIQFGFGTGVGDATDITYERVLLFEHAEGIPYPPDRQAFFLDDLNGGHYKRVKIFGCVSYSATNYFAFIADPVNCTVRGCLALPNLLYWQREGTIPSSTTPGIRLKADLGSGSVTATAIEDTFLPGTVIDDFSGAHPYAGTNDLQGAAASVSAWQSYLAANFTGIAGGFTPTSLAEFFAAYQAKAGGALDKTIDVGALVPGGYFTYDFTGGGISNHPRGTP